MKETKNPLDNSTSKDFAPAKSIMTSERRQNDVTRKDNFEAGGRTKPVTG